METKQKAAPTNQTSETKKVKVDEIARENLELMYSIQKNRNNFCQSVGGC